MLIAAEALSHTYAAGTPLEQDALHDIGLQIRPGERVGVVGRTGSGKSTLAQHLAGLLEPTSGHVLLDGLPAHGRAAEAQSRRRRVGMAFQYPEDQIFERTVFREVAFGPHNQGLRDAKLAARVAWALTMVGLDPDAVNGRMPLTLSGGERRRVALASILAMQPEVLVLDEPTAGLDPRGRAALIDHMKALQDGLGPTLIVVSHDLDMLARVIQRVIVLQDGHVAADGPVGRVLGDGRKLRGCGLDPTAAVVLLEKLREAGWSVHADRPLPEEAAAEIARAVRQSCEAETGSS